MGHEEGHDHDHRRLLDDHENTEVNATYDVSVEIEKVPALIANVAVAIDSGTLKGVIESVCNGTVEGPISVQKKETPKPTEAGKDSSSSSSNTFSILVFFSLFSGYFVKFNRD